MAYDIIFITGEIFFDHPLCGIAILKRLLEKEGFSVGIIESPKNPQDITSLGKPRLFFGVSSGSIDSMVRNYTPLKKKREEDEHSEYGESIPDRAVIVYCNWIRQQFKDTKIVLGGTEASLRRFTHYDYWDNKLRKPILFDSRADILAYGSAEKQIIEIAYRIKQDQSLEGIKGTCILSRQLPEKFKLLPSFEEVSRSKGAFCDMQNAFSISKDLAQKIDTRYLLQYKAPEYTSKDLDSYYELPFTRKITSKIYSGFEFSVVTHRGCIGACNFCALALMQGDKIISRSEESIIREVKKITTHSRFRGNIDDLGGPSANMYGMDCNKCSNACIDCKKLDRSNQRLINLMRRLRAIPAVKKIFVRSGVRFDLCTSEYLRDLTKFHVSGTLKVAPEHVNKNVLKLMNKDKGDFRQFIKDFRKTGKQLSFYFMTAHPGSGMKEAQELADVLKKLRNAESVQIFTPTPMSISTCMYYTGFDPKTKKKIYVPYTYNEKKKQKRVLMNSSKKKRFSR